MARLILLLCLMANPVIADVIAPGGRTIDCYCTDSKGGRVELGESICLYVDGRAFMAHCEMALNNPIWRDTGEGCASSSLIERLKPARDTGLVYPKI